MGSRIYAALVERRRRRESSSSRDPHPFLQFTEPRVALPDGDRAYGFDGVRQSQLPKPEGIVRIAWLGGSKTSGDPRFLEECLNQQVSWRFEVLDFRIDGWSSVHVLLNFILNVREFHPDIALVQNESRDAVCSGYPCWCPGRVHAFTPAPFPPEPFSNAAMFQCLFPIFAARRLVRSLMARFSKPSGVNISRIEQEHGQEFAHIRRNLETVCTLADLAGIRILLMTKPLSEVESGRLKSSGSNREHTQVMNQIVRDVANKRGVGLIDLTPEKSSLPPTSFELSEVTDRIKMLELAKSILSMVVTPGGKVERTIS